jgi:hypothetical protein
VAGRPVAGDGGVEGILGVEVVDADPEVVDVPDGARAAVVHGFGAVAVRVAQEGAVVVGRVIAKSSQTIAALSVWLGSMPSVPRTRR